jgi:hypothetical protein
MLQGVCLQANNKAALNPLLAILKAIDWQYFLNLLLQGSQGLVCLQVAMTENH